MRWRPRLYSDYLRVDLWRSAFHVVGIAPGSSAYVYMVSSTRGGQCDFTRTYTVVLHLAGNPATTAVVNFTPASCDSTPDGMVSALTPVPPGS